MRDEKKQMNSSEVKISSHGKPAVWYGCVVAFLFVHFFFFFPLQLFLLSRPVVGSITFWPFYIPGTSSCSVEYSILLRKCVMTCLLVEIRFDLVRDCVLM